MYSENKSCSEGSSVFDNISLYLFGSNLCYHKLSKAHELTHVLWCFWCTFCRFVLFLFPLYYMSNRPVTTSDYSFSVIKLFLCLHILIVKHNHRTTWFLFSIYRFSKWNIDSFDLQMSLYSFELWLYLNTIIKL